MEDWTKVLRSVILLNKILFKKNTPVSTNSTLNFTQEKVLLSIYDQPMNSQKEIIRYMDRDKGSISKVIQSLVELELVIRHPYPQDRRQVRLELSAAGKKEVLRIKETFAQYVDKAIATLDKEKQKALYTHLDDLLAIAIEIEAAQNDKES